MRSHLVVIFSMIAVAGQAQQRYTAPRTADGTPDLQGIWQVMNTAAVNLEDHIAVLDMPAGRSVIVDPPDGKIPYRPEAAQKQKENFKNRAKAERVLDNPPYNLVIHTSPVQDPVNDHYHWHIEFMPKLTKTAGFEWGTGFYINPTPPEEAAKFLREANVEEPARIT